ncbi:hypothetical protein D9611_008491 [Ephemerocybe angulata]|uniref:HIG1 domain-containing protein n=1 Tax=Ephemerocybe angulata TaxID=980116 RepID=A0A8H5EV14_9AGAR|nr:hypothetical protein D9611_008491 [Tulosesus angulatus]
MSNPYPYGYEGWGEKFSRKVKENPYVPAGCLLTTGALIMSAVKMRKGESKQMNYWMRARVGLQGVTLAALVVGTMVLRAEREKAALADEATIAAPGSDAEALVKQREKDEFEARLKGAEVAVEEEVGLVSRVVRGPAVVKHERQHPTPSAAAPALDSSSSLPVSDAGKKSWWKIW